jgi:hypothetical protein
MENLKLILEKFKEDKLTLEETMSLLNSLLLVKTNNNFFNPRNHSNPSLCSNKECFCDGSCMGIKKKDLLNPDWTYRPDPIPFKNTLNRVESLQNQLLNYLKT